MKKKKISCAYDKTFDPPFPSGSNVLKLTLKFSYKAI